MDRSQANSDDQKLQQQQQQHGIEDGSAQLEDKQTRQSNADPAPKIIKDLNNECLAEIFQCLEKQSLFNMAMANVQLRPIAAYVHNRKFGKRKVIFCIHPMPKNENGLSLSPLSERGNAIAVNGLKTCLLYLRYFGESIVNLKINYFGMFTKSFGHIYQYVNKYAENLVRIEFDWMSATAIEQFSKPFNNVQCVCLRNDCSILGSQFVSFPERFPNVRQLNLDQSMLHQEFIDVSFPHLEHLQFNLVSIDSKSLGLSEESAERLLRSNRQLQSLNINIDAEFTKFDEITLGKILNMIADNSNISKLILQTNVIRVPSYRPSQTRALLSNSMQLQRLANEHSGLVELTMEQFEFTANGAVALVHQLNSLRRFSFKTAYPQYRKIVEETYNEWRSFNHNGQVTLIRRD